MADPHRPGRGGAGWFAGTRRALPDRQSAIGSAPRDAHARRVTIPRVLLTAVLFAVAAACSHKPPADFAPDPGFIRGMRQLRISAAGSACPGGLIGASYEAQLESGLWYPFANRYDKK